MKNFFDVHFVFVWLRLSEKCCKDRAAHQPHLEIQKCKYIRVLNIFCTCCCHEFNFHMMVICTLNGSCLPRNFWVSTMLKLHFKMHRQDIAGGLRASCEWLPTGPLPMAQGNLKRFLPSTFLPVALKKKKKHISLWLKERWRLNLCQFWSRSRMSKWRFFGASLPCKDCHRVFQSGFHSHHFYTWEDLDFQMWNCHKIR